MKNLNKVILVGLTAFWAACSNDAGAESGVSGATTEPSTSPMANLTDEQKVILTKSFKTLVDSAKYVLSSSDEVDDDGIWEPDSNYLEILRLTYPFDSKPEENFAYPSQNGRRKCNVSTYPADLGVVLKQSFNASASFSGPQKKTSSVISSKLVEVDGVPVIVKSVGTESFQNGYWGYGVSCSEYLNRFKQSCSESNGIFKDFGDGCRSLRLTMACSMFAPDGLTEDAVMDSFTEEYKNMCQDDSVKYASVENVWDEFNTTNRAIKDAIGNEDFNTLIFRFPGGRFGGPDEAVKNEAAAQLEDQGIGNIDWNALTRDAESSDTKEQVLQSLKETAEGKTTVVLLMHDASDKEQTVDALQDVIDYFKNEGYTFKTFYDYLGR